MKEKKLTIEQAREIETLLSEYGVSNVLDCDFSDLALYTFADFFENTPHVIAFLSEAVNKVADSPTRTAIRKMIESLGKVQFTLSQLLLYNQYLYSVSKLLCDVSKTLNDGE